MVVYGGIWNSICTIIVHLMNVTRMKSQIHINISESLSSIKVYSVEPNGIMVISEIKLHQSRLVLGWVTIQF